MKKMGSLRNKILLDMILLVIGLLVAAAIIFQLTSKDVSETLTASNKRLSTTIGESSSAYLTEESRSRLLELAGEKAESAEQMFSDFGRGVRVVASVAERIYSDPAAYSPRPVSPPDPKNQGKLTMQVLYSSKVDPEDPKIKEELALIGNVQDTIMSVNASLRNMASLYVATESGFMVQGDYISASKYDDQGKIMPFEAKERPWYRGAAAKEGMYFTPVTKDAHTPRLAIMCGVPVVVGSRRVGVAGAGMYLDDMEELVRSVDIGGKGNACIINGRGQVLFSTYSEGSLAAVEESPDIRASEDGDLADMAKKAVSGESGVTLLDVDGTLTYAAYAPMKTVGWSMVIFLSQKAVDAPTEELIRNVDTITDNTFSDARRHISRATYLLIGLFGTAVLIALAVSVGLSRRIVKPISLLTQKVADVDAEDLDFKWDLDTGDETQMLAKSFESMTVRMKEYINDIETITADRERISTELALATRIQTSMLPNIFPPFPQRSDFDIYAIMDPAREVGGDFYDFFLIDDDHLCLVMADVSGKGVPAALFMMVSKLIIQSCAMLGQRPEEILTKTNESICANNIEEMFVTAWVGVLELSTGKLTAANAGHEYPLVKTPEGPFEIWKDRHGFVIGGIEGQKYTEYEIMLEPGAKVFVYTDGLPEAMGGDDGTEMFGLERAVSVINEEAGGTPREILEHVRGAVDAFVRDAEQFDDMTMLCIEYTGVKEK